MAASRSWGGSCSHASLGGFVSSVNARDNCTCALLCTRGLLGARCDESAEKSVDNSPRLGKVGQCRYNCCCCGHPVQWGRSRLGPGGGDE
jgi:hypothetical protein